MGKKSQATIRLGIEIRSFVIVILMLEGTIVENSLDDRAVLDSLEILRSWTDEDWKLHQVRTTRETALGLADHLVEGPWYVHFWERGKDDVLVVFKHKIFDIQHSDKSTWKDAVAYGKSIGIPEEQLDFLID
ncbi:hypothetical protein K2Q00_01340 [Patescibacteria group bacterium]|nr:hypothetical protein [Patescibacteria group bacterium]